MLQLLHPHVAMRSCEDCQAFLYDDKPDRMGPPEPIRRRGLVVVRPAGFDPPCGWCPKVPDEVRRAAQRRERPRCTPADAVTLSPKNVVAYRFHRECRAVRAWPDDPIVRRNADAIEAVYDLRERVERGQDLAGMVGLLARVMTPRV